jgi:hypothetical protein
MNYIVIAVIVLAALAAVLWPLLKRDPRQPVSMDDETLENRIADYRAALKADTVCDKCLRDNPANAHYCAECGNLLREIEEASK